MSGCCIQIAHANTWPIQSLTLCILSPFCLHCDKYWVQKVALLLHLPHSHVSFSVWHPCCVHSYTENGLIVRNTFFLPNLRGWKLFRKKVSKTVTEDKRSREMCKDYIFTLFLDLVLILQNLHFKCSPLNTHVFWEK